MAPRLPGARLHPQPPESPTAIVRAGGRMLAPSGATLQTDGPLLLLPLAGQAHEVRRASSGRLGYWTRRGGRRDYRKVAING